MQVCIKCNYFSDNTRNFSRHICREKTDFQCKMCKKYYKSNKSLCYHTITSKCKEKVEELTINQEKELIILNEIIKFKNKEIEELKDKTITTNDNLKNNNIVLNLNNNNNNNNVLQINVVVLPHDKPKIDHLTDLDYYNILGRSLNSVPQMIEHIHFNKNKPENHNIYISNIKNKYVMVYNGSNWTIRNRDEIITDLINENEMRMEDWLSSEESIHEKYPMAMKRFEHYLKVKAKDKNLAMIKEEIQMLLYNKRSMIIKN